MAAKSSNKNAKPKSKEEILAGFQALRQEQRQLANKISELEMDLNEHKVVIEALQQVSGAQKCFRLVGGVLIERTVADVLPELETNRRQLPRAVAALQEQLAAKGADINRYMREHDIRLDDRAQPAADQPADKPEPAKPNVLVADR